MTMTLDLWILTAIGIFGAIGYRSGAIQQLSHWIGIAAAYVCSKPLAAALAPALSERMGWPVSLASVGTSALSMPAILIGATLISRGLLNAVIPGEQRNKPDRLAGIVLGAGKAGVIAWAVLSVLVSFEGAAAFPAGMKASLDASSAAGFTRAHGLFDAVPPSALEQFRALAAMREDPEKARALLQDPALRSVLNDPAVKRALKSGETSALLDDPRLRKLLEDPELASKLKALQSR